MSEDALTGETGPFERALLARVLDVGRRFDAFDRVRVEQVTREQ